MVLQLRDIRRGSIPVKLSRSSTLEYVPLYVLQNLTIPYCVLVLITVDQQYLLRRPPKRRSSLGT